MELCMHCDMVTEILTTWKCATCKNHAENHICQNPNSCHYEHVTNDNDVCCEYQATEKGEDDDLNL